MYTHASLLYSINGLADERILDKLLLNLEYGTSKSGRNRPEPNGFKS